MNYRIHRSVIPPDTINFMLSGELNSDHASRLQDLIANETNHQIILDLKEITLVDRWAVQFLAHIEETGVLIKNCPEYVRSWITAERLVHESDGGEPNT